MKRTKQFIWLLAATGMLAVSCVAEKAEPAPVELPGADEVSAAMEVPGTKTYTEDLLVLWSEGDLLTVFPGKNVNSKYVLKSEPGKTFGTFTKVNGSLVGDPLPGYAAVYPYADDVTIDKDGTFTVTLPKEQTYAEDSFGPGANTMVSWSGNGYLPFQNVGGFFVMALTGNAKVNSIEFIGGDQEVLAGKAKISMGDNEEEEGPVVTFDESATDTSIILTCPEPVQLDPETPTNFWIVVPAASYEKGVYVKITYEGDQVLQVGTAEETVEIARNQVYRMETLDITVPVNLSEEGTANCYVVAAPGWYRFKAVQGNTEDTVGEVASAEVLWETFNTDVAPEAGDLVKDVAVMGDYISFVYTGELGNAVIAAKDAEGTILWSWHVWCSPVEVNDMLQTYKFRNVGSWGTEATFMDRNLGAISGTPGEVGFLGLMYQWGRKDPFQGASSIEYEVLAAISTERPAAVVSTSTTGTIEYATQNPMQYITMNANNNDWMWAEPGVYADTQRWGGNNWGRPKAKYDPCPAGYKVPFSNGWGHWIFAMGTVSVTDPDLYDPETHCMDVTELMNCDTPVYIPFTGFMWGDRFGLLGTGRQTLLSSTSSFYNNALYLDCRNNGYVSAHTNNPKTNGCPVRCVKE